MDHNVQEKDYALSNILIKTGQEKQILYHLADTKVDLKVLSQRLGLGKGGLRMAHEEALGEILQGGDAYDAMLNQTNVGDNNNKFYVIQVLESDDGSKFLVYNRWRRVGVKGQDKIHGPFTSHAHAIVEFEEKFLAKTKNALSDRKNLLPKE
ncbi:hypothetical protein PIB30_021774 [Stylosanthes scabra]|uniref:NAD(+) ADP-ribosyltransferase n=1 Tax=Stylosanthes scabra TaxID=79078 RepID=A0ABU6U8W4_9FABA|nr:hypothetical protein [Stylosanthes scabra]